MHLFRRADCFVYTFLKVCFFIFLMPMTHTIANIIGVDLLLFYRHITSDYGWGNAIFIRIFNVTFETKWFGRVQHFVHWKRKCIYMFFFSHFKVNLFDFETSNSLNQDLLVVWYQIRFHFWYILIMAVKFHLIIVSFVVDKTRWLSFQARSIDDIVS